mmetsp:Transcript_24573/g.42267  ORF Transcript_24573/g.42267 Transcript_24573/m.42267 type:complete len:211 (-) Transcript_24573:345-977(-)
MLIPKKDRIAVYKELFKEGVLVAKKDFEAPKHSDEIPVINLHVVKLCQSLKSSGYVKEQFSWQYYYYFLTEEGIIFLRKYLHLPSDVVPQTWKKTARPQGRPPGPGGPRYDRGDREGGAGRGGFDREGYRSAPRRDGEEGKKVSGPEGDFKPEFRGGFGRGGFGRGGATRQEGGGDYRPAPAEGGFGRGGGGGGFGRGRGGAPGGGFGQH